jgi:UDP-N-acetylglucosamine/UDP-N-acetylgalactosamine diphosphorylase
MADEQQIRDRYASAGQSHVFDYYDSLNVDEKEKLLSQLDEIQVERLDSLLKSALEQESAATSDADIKPFGGPVGRTTDEKLVADCSKVGMEAIAKGQVAALVLAGGQGTRLGYDGPKGMYDIGLPSKKSLFQLMAERIKRLETLAGDNNVIVPFYIMTSPLNHAETEKFWESHNYFGLGKENVSFFSQGMLPCMKDDGKIIMETAGEVAMAPDGNGGIYPSMVSSGALADMEKRGVKYLHVFSIDNALIKPADPVFMGYCINQGSDCGNKVCWKVDAAESVGVVATRSGKPCIVEYSEISKEMAESVDEDGRLVYGAGNICNHFYTIAFIKDKIIPNLGNLYHIARKKIKYYDGEKKETITPSANTGLKLETFIFDVFPFSENMAVLDVDRSMEFAPVKNKPGSPADSPDTARELISAMSKTFVTAAGGKLTGDESGICEVSPLTSYSGEGMEEIVQGRKIICPFSL